MPALVRLTPWADPVLDTLGHDPRSWYAETFWLPTLGPDGAAAAAPPRRPVRGAPEGLTLPVADTAAALGLGPRDGEQSPLVRSLHRLVQFDLALAARARGHRRAPHAAADPPPARAPPARRGPGPSPRLGRRAKPRANRSNPLAAAGADESRSTLLVEGESRDTVERALHRAGFHPASRTKRYDGRANARRTSSGRDGVHCVIRCFCMRRDLGGRDPRTCRRDRAPRT